MLSKGWAVIGHTLEGTVPVFSGRSATTLDGHGDPTRQVIFFIFISVRFFSKIIRMGREYPSSTSTTAEQEQFVMP